MDANTEIEYKIVLEFDSFSKVGFFLQDLENWQDWKKKKTEQRVNDQRGKHTLLAHQRARVFQNNNPAIPYRECFKLANMKS